MIPRLLHSVWIGPNPLPSREQSWSEQMKRMNPDWKYALHGNDDLEKWRKTDPFLRELLSRSEPWAFIADRLRVLILKSEGGVYLDVDCQPVRPLSVLNDVWNAPHVTFITSHRNAFKEGVALSRGISLVDNTFFGTAPNSRMIQAVSETWALNRVVVNGNMCGKMMMNRSGLDTVWLDYQHFYSDAPCPEAICLHDGHNLGSWVEPMREKLNLMARA